MITIYGYSDDLVEVEGAVGADPEEYNVADSSDGKVHWRADFIQPVQDGNARLRVYAIYDGCWHFSVGQVDEDHKLPTWPITITQAPNLNGNPGYSALLSIDAPAGTVIADIWPDPEDES